MSPELAAGIRRVKGAKRLGTRIGNWLTAISAARSYARHVRILWRGRGSGNPGGPHRMRLRRPSWLGCRPMTFKSERNTSCGRSNREGQAHPNGSGAELGQAALDARTQAGITTASYRAVGRSGAIWGDHITPKAIWHVVKGLPDARESRTSFPMTFVARGCVTPPEENWSRFSVCRMSRCRRPSGISAANRNCKTR